MNSLPKTSVHVAATESILWKGDFLPGHEACRLFPRGTEPRLEGTAVFSHEGLPCRLDYQILCDAAWRTLSTEVKGWVGNTNINIRLQVTPAGGWQLNGTDQPALAGCIDVDLNFSPCTNTLPIHRLNLAIGETAEIKAAWLRFPSFRLEPLAQTYKRLSELAYRYESSGGKFVADLKVDAAGFVIDYPNIWKSEAVYENAG
jgi:uncharacterized protein